MAIQPIELTKEDIKNTKVYSELNTMRQQFVVKRSNMLQIQNGVNISMNIGYDNWLKQSNFNWQNRAIVKELMLKYE